MEKIMKTTEEIKTFQTINLEKPTKNIEIYMVKEKLGQQKIDIKKEKSYQAKMIPL